MNRKIIQQFLIKKEEESLLKNTASKKEALKQCFDLSRAIPHELRADAEDILSEIIHNIVSDSEHPRPRVVVTTSRDPSSKLREFSKRLSLVFNGSLLSRGNATLSDISSYATECGATCLMILREAKGVPRSVTFSFYPKGPTFSFSIDRFECRKRSGTFAGSAAIIFEGFEGEIDLRVKTFFSLLFEKRKRYRRQLVMAKAEGKYVLASVADKSVDLFMEMSVYEVKKSIFLIDCDEWNIEASRKRENE